MKKLKIDVWSDIVCPWCYVGKRRLEAALSRFSQRDAVVLRWRAFELDPSAPRERDPMSSYAARLAKKYGSSAREAERMIARMTDTGRAEGISFRFDRMRPGNTFDAHRLLRLAAERGRGDAMNERLLLATMTEGEPVGDPEVLVRLAAEAGLDGEEVRAVLASHTFGREVREDETDAAELGISAVPFFVIGGRYAVAGAQPADALLRTLEQAWRDVTSWPPPSFTEAAACGREGCG